MEIRANLQKKTPPKPPNKMLTRPFFFSFFPLPLGGMEVQGVEDILAERAEELVDDVENVEQNVKLDD